MGPDELVGYLRAEYQKTGKIRVWLFAVQLLVAVPGALSVVITNAVWTYLLAVGAVVFLIIWWTLNVAYLKGRDAAHSARRAAILRGGLGQAFSPSENSSLRDRMSVSAAQAQASAKSDYYATQHPPSPARMAEMVEESAFYSAELQSASATVMATIIGAFAILFAVIAFAATPFVANSTTMTMLRIFLAALVFAMSSDVLGAFIAHRNAARSIGDIKSRLKIARTNGFPLTDVLLIAGDYSSAVEGAPESVPFAYNIRESSLNDRWRQYQIDNRISPITSATP